MPRTMVINGPNLTAPEWTNDVLHPDKLLPSGVPLDPAQFNAPDAVVVTISGAGAIQGATSLPLATAIPAGRTIPSGTVLDFGTTRLAVTSAVAHPGDMALSVRATPTAIPAAAVATYAGTQPRRVPSGTVIGRTFAERAAGTAFGPAAAGDEEVTIVAFNVPDVTRSAWATVLRERAGITIKEARLPNWNALTTAVQALVRARFVTQITEP